MAELAADISPSITDLTRGTPTTPLEAPHGLDLSIFRDNWTLDVTDLLKSPRAHGAVRVAMYATDQYIVLLATDDSGEVVGKCGTGIINDTDTPFDPPPHIFHSKAMFSKLHITDYPEIFGHSSALALESDPKFAENLVLNGGTRGNTWQVDHSFKNTGLGTNMFELFLLTCKARGIERAYFGSLTADSIARLHPYGVVNNSQYNVPEIPLRILNDPSKFAQIQAQIRGANP